MSCTCPPSASAFPKRQTGPARARCPTSASCWSSSIARPRHALVVDDIGYVQHDRDEMEVLFTLLADRYERRSVMLTSNLPFSKWETIFKDPMTTAAAIDRLVHHSVILKLNIKSYRLEHSKSARKEAGQQEQNE